MPTRQSEATLPVVSSHLPAVKAFRRAGPRPSCPQTMQDSFMAEVQALENASRVALARSRRAGFFSFSLTLCSKTPFLQRSPPVKNRVCRGLANPCTCSSRTVWWSVPSPDPLSNDRPHLFGQSFLLNNRPPPPCRRKEIAGRWTLGRGV